MTPQTVGIVTVLVSAVVRLASLDAFPTFTDEAVYVRWATRFGESPSAETMWLSTHEDWKSPAIIWLLALAHRLLDDQILIGRLVASLSGVLTVAFVYQAGVRLFGPWTGAIAAATIGVSPALVFTSRLALTDSPVVLLTAITLWLSVPALRGHWLSAIGAGTAVGLALWTKLSGA